MRETETTYYRLHDESREPVEALLVPGRESRVWVGEVYRRCETCGGFGVIDDPDYDPEYDDDPDEMICPECSGAGEVEDVRSGVSCCRSLDALRDYFSERDYYTEGCVVVEMAGELSDDDDWEADCGAVLIHPAQIVRVLTVSECGL